MKKRLMDHAKILVVEGKDEQYLIPELLEKCGVLWPRNPHPFEIQEQGGVENILANGFIQTKLKESRLQALGIVVDADEAPHEKWQSILREIPASYGAPALLPPGGLILPGPHADGPRLGVWIMPDNQTNGMIETLIAQLRKGTPDLLEHIDASICQARKLGAAFRTVHTDKARVHTWLAWQDPPGAPMGQAVLKNMLKVDDPILNKFVTWARKLFDV